MDLLEWLRWAVGWDTQPSQMQAIQMVFRALAIYAGALILVRVGSRRLLGKSTPFDVVLGFVFGSTLSRSINGSATLGPTLAAAAAIVAVHWLMSAVAMRSDAVSLAVKGRALRLVEDGRVLWPHMRRQNVGERDLQEELRLRGKTEQLDSVAAVYLERNGEMSVIPRDRSPKVIEVRVEAGVQTVRIELS